MSNVVTAPFSSSRIDRFLLAFGIVLGVAFATLMLQINMHMVDSLSPRHTMSLMLINLALILLIMSYSVGRRAMMLWRRARSGLIGTRLQSRIILMFCVIAIIPTIAVSLFSAYFFNYGIKTWFDSRVSHALEDSITVAAAYLEEHKGAIRSDALSMAPGIASSLSLISSNPQRFSDILNDQIETHHLSEAIIFDGQHVLARTALSFSLAFERLPEEVLRRADAGNVVVFGENQDKIQAVLKISNSPRWYMMVSRVVDPIVLKHMDSARRSVAQYEELQSDISVLQQQFFLIFMMVALMVLLASVWAGIKLAVWLIDPLAALMIATERVRAGDYSIKVPEGRVDDEIANLGRTFNRMTGQLEAQRRDLMEANRLGDERRRFAEAVLSGVSAGIVAIDAKAEITLHNRIASELLGVAADESMVGKNITELLSEVTPILALAQARPERIASGDIVTGLGTERRTLHVQVVAERFNQTIEGFIVTFDDITELVVAQRSAAWADVARRVAHEIKNPLTPITLSAERLRKKFGAEITSDRESYDRYLDTIARHVRDIGRMVEEFVAYARVPTAKFSEENLNNIIRKSVFSERTVHPDIHYQMLLPETPVMVHCDESQIGQILTNLLKNAAEALEQTPAPKTIVLTIEQTSEFVTLIVCDNGSGFPTDLLERLTDPYVTTRAKGTGLGLSIVKRTMEEHGGTISLANVPEGGAEVTLRFPKNSSGQIRNNV